MLNSRSFALTKWFHPVNAFIKSKGYPSPSLEVKLVDGSALVVERLWTDEEYLRLQVYEQGGEASLRFVPYQSISQIIVRRQADESGRPAFDLREDTH